MTLTLSIRNVAALENGAPTQFVLHRRGAMIGRAPTCDWSLPDPHRYISSRHCEIAFRDERYVLTDVSTNGTFLNGAGERMAGERTIATGDLIQIGHYEVVAELSGSALAALASEAAPPPPAWKGWDSSPAASPPPPAAEGWDDAPYAPSPQAQPQSSASDWAPAPAGWDTPPDPRPANGWEAPVNPAHPAASRWGAPPPPPPPPAAASWDPSHRIEPPKASVWSDPAPAPEPASEWSSAAPDRPAQPSVEDVWGRIAEGNVVDWARGGFGQPASPPPSISNGLGGRSAAPSIAAQAPLQPTPTVRPEPPVAPAVAPRGDSAPPATPKPAAPPAAAPAPADPGRLVEDFLAAAGLSAAEVKQAGPESVARGGALLRRLVAGLVVLVEARARAKAQMGAECTRLEFDGNNPIKFARTPEQALAQLLGPKERGFMDAERAIEDSFFDLQSHQMATLKAMQGALKATLDRFSPEAIRARTESKGLLAKMLPAARDAALWQNYEREFSGVAKGSDEAFMDVFAKEFRKAYEEQARQRK